jgi:hypothetical protein
MTTRPYELLARFAADGTVAGVSIKTITTINGRDYESDPTPLSDATDPAFKAFSEQFAASVVSDRDQALAALETQRATMQAEIDRLTELVPAPAADHMITPAEFVARLETASPGVIDRLWESDAKEAGRLAVTLFTWTDRIDCRSGGRLEAYLNVVAALGFMTTEQIAKVWIK